MKRDNMLARMTGFKGAWDFIIIGGGATGLGTAIEAASRGYETLLLEQKDFGQGTSSRSTKLIHGGIRYLRQGNISLVLEALKERGQLLANAPHLVHNLPFVVPNYEWWEGPFYGIGLKIYDLMAGRHGFGKSKILDKKQTQSLLPTIEPWGLRGGVIYYDGQFDDSRLIINMAETAVREGATLLNYMKAQRLTRANGGIISGVIAGDGEAGKEYELKAKAVINATGVFADSIRKMDQPNAPAIIKPSRGVHLVLDKTFLPGDSAVMVPHTDDGRILFAIPWHDAVIVGTTDTPVEEPSLEPYPSNEELEFLLSHIARYLTRPPAPGDVLSVFAGLRPLVSCGGEGGKEEHTAAISRDHVVSISRSGLVTIAGGKWTTYRKMAEDTVNQAAVVAQLECRPSVSGTLPIHGYHKDSQKFGTLAVYGSDAPRIQELSREGAGYGERLHPLLSVTAGEVVWAVRNEMARRVEDILSRRRRALLLNAKASMDIAPRVAALMAAELGKDAQWQKEEIRNYRELARNYLFPTFTNYRQ